MTYYIVQTSPSEFLGRSCGNLGREPARAAEDAQRLTLPEARSVLRKLRRTYPQVTGAFCPGDGSIPDYYTIFLNNY